MIYLVAGLFWRLEMLILLLGLLASSCGHRNLWRGLLRGQQRTKELGIRIAWELGRKTFTPP